MRSLLVVALVLCSAPAFGEETIKDIPPGEDVIEPLSQGSPAPFNGQLFDINTSLRWANWLTQYEAVLAAEIERSKATCKAELEYQAKLGSVDVERLTRLNEDLHERLKRSEGGRLQAEYERDNPAWYTSMWFGMAVGAVGTAGLVFLGAQSF